jgi:hypothetical protein
MKSIIRIILNGKTFETFLWVRLIVIQPNGRRVAPVFHNNISTGFDSVQRGFNPIDPIFTCSQTCRARKTSIVPHLELLICWIVPDAVAEYPGTTGFSVLVFLVLWHSFFPWLIGTKDGIIRMVLCCMKSTLQSSLLYKEIIDKQLSAHVDRNYFWGGLEIRYGPYVTA